MSDVKPNLGMPMIISSPRPPKSTDDLFVVVTGKGLTIQCLVCQGTLRGTGWPIDEIQALVVAMRAGHERCRKTAEKGGAK